MLTQKEVKFLNFIFKNLRGEQKNYEELKQILKKKYGFNDKNSFELAYLYDKNWTENGFSDTQEDIKRMSYEEYLEKMPWQVKAVMKIVGIDVNPDNYEFDGYDTVTHDGTDYKIYDSYDDLESSARDNYDPCDNIDDDEYMRSYVYMSDTDRRIFAQEEADSRVDNMDDEDIINSSGYGEQIETLEELEDLEKLVEEKTDEMETLVHQLDDFEGEQKEEIEQKIADYETEIEELEDKISNIKDLGTKEEIIEKAMEELKSSLYDEIYDELSDPVEYFVDNTGIYGSVKDLIDNGPAQFDCDTFTDDFFSNQDIEGLVYNVGYSEWEEIRTEEHGYVYVLWS